MPGHVVRQTDLVAVVRQSVLNMSTMGYPDFKKTQRALHLELVKIAAERARDGETPVVTPEQSPLSAALDYIDAFGLKVAVKPEPGGGTRNVGALQDKGLALAHALLGISAELQDEDALRLVATYSTRLNETVGMLEGLSNLGQRMTAMMPQHGLGWAQHELALDDLEAHLSLVRATLTARKSLLAALTRETWQEEEDVRQRELLGMITELLGDAFKPSEIAHLVDDGNPPDPPSYQRVRKRLKARDKDRPRRNWEAWFIGRSEDGQYIRIPAGTIERRLSKAHK